MERVIAYVDGYNLYYGLREKQWKWFYWLNVQAMARHLLKTDQRLVTTKYFTTIVKQPEDASQILGRAASLPAPAPGLAVTCTACGASVCPSFRWDTLPVGTGGWRWGRCAAADA
jgi:hypothetical protein